MRRIAPSIGVIVSIRGFSTAAACGGSSSHAMLRRSALQVAMAAGQQSRSSRSMLSFTRFAIGSAPTALSSSRMFSTSCIRFNEKRDGTNVSEKKEDNAAASSSGAASSSSPSASSNESTATPSQAQEAAAGSENPTEQADIERVDERPNGIVRVKRMPLILVEEVPLPMKLMGDLELIMSAWSEEHARQYKFMIWLVRILVFVCSAIIVFFFYRSMISSERMIRGVGHVPQEMKVGCIVYLDIQEEGKDIGRIVIGLLTEICPLYCEYFHRRCTGSGGKGDSFRGIRMLTLVPRHVVVMGEGRGMTHDVEGFEPHFLPTEALQTGPWRGCLSSIATAENRESPNFAIHSSSADYGPQVFGIVLGGYDVVERMHATGVSHGANPRRSYVVSNCGELCTLDKANVVPLPWKLYESVSEGYDEERFGARSDWATMTPTTNLFETAEQLTNRAANATLEPIADAVAAAKQSSGKKAWYKFW